MALDRTRHVQWAADSEVFADMVNAMDKRRIGEVAQILIDQDRVILPTVPKSFGDIQKLGRSFISTCVFYITVFAEIECLLVHTGGNYIPAGSPVAEVVQRGKRSCKIVGLTVGA